MNVGQQETSRERLIFLSDAVFAIAMTLLALELVPRDIPQESGLIPMLEHSTRKVLGFIISFVVIGVHWLGNVRNMHLIRRADGTFLILSLLMLMVVCFLPYPTAVLGEIGPNRVAVTFYAATVTFLSLTQFMIWGWAASGRRLLAPDVPAPMIRRILARIVVPLLVFAASIVIAQFNPRVAMWSWAAIAPLMLATRLLERKSV